MCKVLGRVGEVAIVPNSHASSLRVGHATLVTVASFPMNWVPVREVGAAATCLHSVCPLDSRPMHLVVAEVSLRVNSLPVGVAAMVIHARSLMIYLVSAASAVVPPDLEAAVHRLEVQALGNQQILAHSLGDRAVEVDLETLVLAIRIHRHLALQVLRTILSEGRGVEIAPSAK